MNWQDTPCRVAGECRDNARPGEFLQSLSTVEDGASGDDAPFEAPLLRARRMVRLRRTCWSSVRSADNHALLSEFAEKLKLQGNEHHRTKRYQEAIDFFIRAIEAKPVGSALLQSCYLNCAAFHLD